MRKPFDFGPYPTAEQLLPETLRALKDEQARMAVLAAVYFGGFDPVDYDYDVVYNDSDARGASHQRMSEAYGTTAVALKQLILDHNRRVTRATNSKLAELPDSEIDAIIASFENY